MRHCKLGLDQELAAADGVGNRIQSAAERGQVLGFDLS